MTGHGTLRRVIGVLLEIWGGIRLVVDALESINATKAYVASSYAQLIAAPSSRTLTVAVIATGTVLLVAEPIKKWWQRPREQSDIAPVEPAAISEPCIYFAEVLDKTDLYLPASPLVLENRGHDVAHGVQILPVTLGHVEVKFDYVDTIAVGDKVEVIPRINYEGAAINNFLGLLKKELEDKNKAQAATEQWIAVPLTVVYKNRSRSHNFETLAELSYCPINRDVNSRAEGHGWKDWPHQSFPWFKIDHREFKKT